MRTSPAPWCTATCTSFFPLLSPSGRVCPLLAGSCSRSNSFVYRIARGGGVTTGTPLAGSMDVEVYGSLNIIGAGDPSPGATPSLRFSEPSSPGALYLAGASLSTSPGISTSAGMVDLTPDTLFALSQTAPAISVNFIGMLDVKGSAIASVVVPPLPGLGSSLLQLLHDPPQQPGLEDREHAGICHTMK